MLKFDKKIVQFGFGAIGKSFFEKLSYEISYNENNYYVISRDKTEFKAYISLGGIAKNFIISEVNKENFIETFEQYLCEGDLLIDFADTVGTRDILKWCIEKNIMYINTGEADWPDNWYSIYNENNLKTELKVQNKNLKHPILLQHGNNPGLVSHFVKAGLEYIVNTQHKKNKQLKQLVKFGKWNELAHLLAVKTIHVNDIDLQTTNIKHENTTLVNTWCIDSFYFEMLSEATFSVGTHENINSKDRYKFIDIENGFAELKEMAIDTKIKTYYPNGMFEAFLVPHEETITISKNLEVRKDGKTIYRPTVMFCYSPCQVAKQYFKNAKLNNYPLPDMSKPLDCENINNQTIVRGYLYPQNSNIIYKENIIDGTEYVGVLLLGDNFEPVWVGNRITEAFLYKNKNSSYWQTPTITPVSMSALAAVCWMIKNVNKGGIYFPDDIPDYKSILKVAEKYISKTIYTTFSKDEIQNSLNIDISSLQFKDFKK